MLTVENALKQYGATIGLGGQIVRNEKSTGVVVNIRSGRIRFASSESCKSLASGPVSARTVETFVESFWFWEKK